MRADVAFRFLADRRRAMVGWSLGIAVYTLLMLVLWPSFVRDSESYQDLADDLPDGLDALFGPGGIDLSTPAGFLNSYLFAMIVPLLLVVAGVSAGAGILGGEEEDGTLELLLAHPLSRRRVVAEKALALVAYLLVLAVTVFVVIAVVGPFVDMDGIAVGNVAAACLGTLFVGSTFGLAALLVGAIAGRRGSAAGIGAGLAGLGYLLQVVAELSDDWDGVRYLSPFYLANGTSPIENGVPAPEYLGLLGIAIALWLLATIAFRRRDLRA